MIYRGIEIDCAYRDGTHTVKAIDPWCMFNVAKKGSDRDALLADIRQAIDIRLNAEAVSLFTAVPNCSGRTINRVRPLMNP